MFFELTQQANLCVAFSLRRDCHVIPVRKITLGLNQKARCSCVLVAVGGKGSDSHRRQNRQPLLPWRSSACKAGTSASLTVFSLLRPWSSAPSFLRKAEELLQRTTVQPKGYRRLLRSGNFRFAFETLPMASSLYIVTDYTSTVYSLMRTRPTSFDDVQTLGEACLRFRSLRPQLSHRNPCLIVV